MLKRFYTYIYPLNSLRAPIKILLPLVFLFLAVLACEEVKNEKPIVKQRVFPGYHVLLDDILRSPKGVFRGITLNTAPDQIKQMETIAPVENAEGHLYYEFKADSLTNYSIDYTFDNDSLEEISIQINTDDLELSSYLFCDLKDYYANKLPNPTEEKGQIVYNCFEGQRKPFVVSLSDNSSPTKGIINMVIYKDR